VAKRDKAAEVEAALAVWAGGAAVEGMAAGFLGPVLSRERSQRSRDVLRARLQKLGEEIGRSDLVAAVLDGLPETAPAPEEDSGDGWWRDALRGGAATRKHQGGVLLGVCTNVRGHSFEVTVTVEEMVEPRILIIDPSVGGGELSALRFGTDSMMLGGDNVPIATFQPTSWVNLTAMRRASTLRGRRLEAGSTIEIAGKLDEPGRFRAVLWCVGFDAEGRPLGEVERVSPTAQLDAAVVDAFVAGTATLPEAVREQYLQLVPKALEPLMAAMSAAVRARSVAAVPSALGETARALADAPTPARRPWAALTEAPSADSLDDFLAGGSERRVR